MRLLIDILGPSHAHFFHPFIEECRRTGHVVLIAARPRGITGALLDDYGHSYLEIGPAGRRGMDLVWEVFLRTRALAAAAARFRPDALLGVLGTSIAAAGIPLGIPVHVFADDETALVSNWLTFRRATEVIAPRSFEKKIPGKRVAYPGPKSLAYLHPRRFRPDAVIREELGLEGEERLAILRLAASEVREGLLRRGLGHEGRRRLVEALLGRCRILVSCDGPLPPDLERLRLHLPPARFHHAVAAADLIISETRTTAAEAAALGTPAVYCASGPTGSILDAGRRHGLVLIANCEGAATAAARDILDRPPAEARTERELRRRRILDEGIDVTAWMVEHFGLRERKPEPRAEMAEAAPAAAGA